MNRFQLETTRAGIAAELNEANQHLMKMYADGQTDLDGRTEQKNKVADLKERLEGINKQIQEIDEDAARKMGGVNGDPVIKKVDAKAEIIRATLQNRPLNQNIVKAGLTDTTASGGDKFLPKTVATEILTEPPVKNPLRELSTLTNITNLEIPRISFTLSDDDFIADGETAKELSMIPATVQFGRNKFKVFADVSETVLLGTNTNLVQTVDMALASGLAKKEKKVAFATAPKETEKHMSFYNQTVSGTYDIKAMECETGTSLFKAILAALDDLEEDYRENASIVMRRADYSAILDDLANGSTTLYGVQPESVLGKPVVFCDAATIPIVGDFSYSHFNYDIGMLYERDKNIKTGMESFVLTAWFDHQIKLKAAFRLVTIKSV